jgi:pilus assembly protein Flp/PilA
MKQKFIAYLKDESGQTSTEYILLVAVAAAIVIKFKGAITKQLMGDDGTGGILGDVMGGVSKNIQSDLLK